jgi:multicomponent K+:H+ antiporter subunit D
VTHLPVMPVVLPLAAGAVLVLLHRAPVNLRRMLAILAAAVQLVLAIGLLRSTIDGTQTVYLLGNWPAFAGIVLVVDRLAALMVLLTATLALIGLLYALAGQDRRTPQFHALYAFQVAGLSGAFLTGDLFNLFVFFEVLLISSYGLLLHGGGANRLRRSLHYVTFNLLGSALFLVAVAVLYGVLGTLNMADLAQKIAQAPAADALLIQSAGLLLLGVFALKAALLPLYLWLPNTYAAASAPVAMLFAVMTKVGVYAVLRVYTLLFGPDAGVGADLAWPWLLPVGLATIALAAFGALAAQSLRRLVGYLIVGSTGTLFVAIASASEASIGAALFYLLHSTLATAALFLLADMVRRGRQHAGDSLRRVDALAHRSALGLAFVLAAVSVAALPPMAGFLAKAMVLDAIGVQGHGAWIWTVILGSSLGVVVALARAGSHLFWRGDGAPEPAANAALRPRLPERAALGLLLLLGVALALFAQPVSEFTRATAAQLLAPQALIMRVLGAQPRAQLEPQP